MKPPSFLVAVLLPLLLLACTDAPDENSFFESDATSMAAGDAEDTRLYELRVYTATPGKLDALQARFRDHTLGLFEKHGLTNVGYWVPVENENNQLVYVVSFPDRAARDSAWTAFREDPDWIAAKEASEVDGSLTTSIESIFLERTDYSPPVATELSGEEPHLFEWRTYHAEPGKLDALHTRFRDHTVDLFTKHDMQHVAYWRYTEAEQGADSTLTYILAYPDQAARDSSWQAFLNDPVWQEAYEASRADGPLIDYVDSVFMNPADYSPIQ